MKKKILLTIFLLAAISPIAYAQVLQQPTAKIKFGLYIGSSFFVSGEAGIFGEYTGTEAIGVQTALVYFYDKGRLGLVAGSNLHYISLPILVRFYPGDDRQFCWFGGTRLGYLISGKARFLSSKYVPLLQKWSRASEVDLLEIKEVNRFQVGMVVGCDYTFEFGLILGLSYVKEFMKIISVNVGPETYGGDYTITPIIGYNFGIFLK